MISCIQGEVWEVNDDNLVVLAGGLGYQVYVPLACFAATEHAAARRGADSFRL